MAASALDLGQVCGSSLPVSAGGAYFSPLSPGRSEHGLDHHIWEAPESLSYRSHSLPGMQTHLQTPAVSADWTQLDKSSQWQHQQHSRVHPVTDTESGQRNSFQGFQLHSREPSQQQPEHQQARQLAKEHSDTSQKSADSAFDKKTILIWDLDETLILFHSLLSGVYADRHLPLKAKEAANLGRKWQESILDLCDQHFFFTEIENYDQTTTSALAHWDDHQNLAGYDFSSDGMEAPDNDDEKRKLSYRFRKISQIYSQGIRPLARDSLELQNWNWLYNATDKLTKGWLTHGSRLLQQVTASAKSGEEAMSRAPSSSSSSSWQSACGDAFGHSMMDQNLFRLMSRTSGSSSGHFSTADNADVVNVLVTTGQLVPTLGKLLLFKLDGAFKATSVYSARNEGKAHCFDLIKERFGEDCNYVAIGDGAEEQQCAAQRQWPFVKVSLQSQAEKTAKVVGQALAAFPPDGCLLTNMHVEHLTQLWTDS